MKTLVLGIVAAGTLSAMALDSTKVDNPGRTERVKEIEKEIEAGSFQMPVIWGFGNYGFYSGYQLYGSILNTEPTLQGYIEANVNLPWSVGNWDNLGYLGAGFWNNSDLTGKRTADYRRAFNELDPNVHWGKIFWIDDDKTWGVNFRTSFIWYCYPITSNRHPVNPYTMDWDHSFELLNPYVIPYITVVHEYRRTYSNLLQFGVKKPFADIFGVEGLSACPFIEFVWRDRRYGWCFTGFGEDADGEMIAAGLATMKLELDLTYMFNKWIGVFAKVAYCQNLDPHLRERANEIGGVTPFDTGAFYGRYNEFCWGGVGVCLNF